MEKKESSKNQNMKDQKLESRNVKTSLKSKNQKDRSLPWWVELLFVQIGLPDNWLVKLLKANKKSKELINDYKKPIFTFIFVFAGMAYFYPVVKTSKSKLNCEATAQNYISKNKNLASINKKELRMLSTNYCNGGSETFEIETLTK